jgi:hypothetical protein
MRGLLADVNAEGYLQALMRVCRGPGWRGLWLELRVPVFTFDDLSIDRELADSEIWAFCQREGLVLLTDNRNEEGEDSLGATIRSRNAVESLPVVTPADARRLLVDRAYCERAAIELMEILMDIESRRGAGRLFIPRET